MLDDSLTLFQVQVRRTAHSFSMINDQTNLMIIHRKVGKCSENLIISVQKVIRSERHYAGLKFCVFSCFPINHLGFTFRFFLLMIHISEDVSDINDLLVFLLNTND